MIHDRHAATALLDLPPPQDDTEESIVGADWHQNAIAHAQLPLQDYAEERLALGLGPWYVSAQVTVQVPLRDRLWSPKPDLFVVPNISPEERTSYDTRVDGPMPPFILEVASKDTWKSDAGRDNRNNKHAWYGAVGVQEYLVFDPMRSYLPMAILGWHATTAGWRPWEPSQRPDGTQVWHSSILGLAVRAEGRLVRFDHPQHGPLPITRELRAQLAQERQALAQERRRRQELEAELRRLRGEHPPQPPY